MSFIGPSIHACRILKRNLLVLKGDKDVFDSILKPLVMQSPLLIDKDINYEDSDDSPIVKCEVVNLFCE